MKYGKLSVLADTFEIEFFSLWAFEILLEDYEKFLFLYFIAITFRGFSDMSPNDVFCIYEDSLCLLIFEPVTSV